MIQANTKTFNITPIKNGKQLITIPSGIFGQDETVIDNPTISVTNPTTGQIGITFGIQLKFMQGAIERAYVVNESYTYDEIFAKLASADFSNYYSSGATNATEFLGYLMVSMANVYDSLLNEVEWLKGKLQEVPA